MAAPTREAGLTISA